MRRKIKYFNVMLAGEVWYGHLTEEKADYECQLARSQGRGMMYVEAE